MPLGHAQNYSLKSPQWVRISRVLSQGESCSTMNRSHMTPATNIQRVVKREKDNTCPLKGAGHLTKATKPVLISNVVNRQKWETTWTKSDGPLLSLFSFKAEKRTCRHGYWLVWILTVSHSASLRPAMPSLRSPQQWWSQMTLRFLTET